MIEIVSTASSDPRVLVVDDTESNRYVLTTWLRRAGYDVVEAQTGEEGLAAVHAGGVDLIVLDIYLPDMSGYAVCELVKADRSTADIPVLHVSSVATLASDRSEGLRRGAEGFLAEPIEREELLATVEALMRGAAAQRTAARLARRLQHLNEATLAVNRAAGLEHLVAEIASQAARLFEASAIAAVVVEDTPLMAAASRDSATHIRPVTVKEVDELVYAAAPGAVIESSTLAASLRATIEEGQLFRALLSDVREPRGVLLVGTSGSAHAPASENTAVLGQFARAAGTTLQNMRSLDIERTIALTLQQSLLPNAVQPMPGIELKTRYAASAAHSDVGGDFYEIFRLDDGAVAIAIGDVVGHSLEAATIMAQLRTGIRCYALEGHAPDVILKRLNRLLYEFHPETTATVCLARYEPETGRCEIANAGHLPPLLVRDGKTTLLPLGGPLLGIVGPCVPPHILMLEPQDTLLFYTDGLIERPGRSLDEGLELLAQTAQEWNGSLDQLCDDMLALMPAKTLDDVAIVAMRRTD